MLCGERVANNGVRMAEPRKIFRIEQTAAARLEPGIENAQGGLRHAEIMRELRALRTALSVLTPASRAGVAAARGAHNRLSSELHLIAGAIRGGGEDPAGAESEAQAGAELPPMPRIAQELHAVVEGSERATQKILAAAEEIDIAANNLSAALDGKIEQDLAHDIQDLVIQIFEACNFQDLIGQRVVKILATLNFVEDHIARVLEEIKTGVASAQRNGAHALHGPPLAGEYGHATQADVDALFADTVRSDKRAASGE